MTDDRELLSEVEATRLWQRAEELQAEEARRAEARAAADADPGVASDARPVDGYALTHVRAAALEAGIGEEFVDAALAKVRADRHAGAAVAVHGRRIAKAVLGSPDDWLVVRRRIRATPAQVLAAMEALLPHEPYTLTLRERVGDPTGGGTLVFDIQGAGFGSAAHPGFRGDASFADLREVWVTLLPLDGGEASDVVLRGPVAWAFTLNAAGSGVMTAVTGGIGMMLGVAIGTGVAALGPVGLGVAVAVGGGVGGTGGLALFRAIYRYGLGRGRRALDALLATVAARAEGGWGFAPGGAAEIAAASDAPGRDE